LLSTSSHAGWPLCTALKSMVMPVREPEGNCNAGSLASSAGSSAAKSIRQGKPLE